MAMATTSAPPYSLLTFPPMINSETCRFILARYQIPYKEDAHVFPWTSVLSLWYAQSIQFPVLHGGGLRLVGPRPLVDHFEPDRAAAQKLIPADKGLADQVEADWSRYNGDLATVTAVVAYYYLLPHRDLLIEPFSRGAPAIEKSILKLGYPLLAWLLGLILQLNEKNAQDSLAQVRIIFDETDRRLKDGRRFLVGESFTLADLALATAAAPVLVPKGDDSPIPPLDRMPPEMAAIVAEMRQHATARFVQRMFDEYRRP